MYLFIKLITTAQVHVYLMLIVKLSPTCKSEGKLRITLPLQVERKSTITSENRMTWDNTWWTRQPTSSLFMIHCNWNMETRLRPPNLPNNSFLAPKLQTSLGSSSTWRRQVSSNPDNLWLTKDRFVEE